jgi:hypothetical protein
MEKELQKENEALKAFVKEADAQIADLKANVEAFEAMGTVEEIEGVIAKASEMADELSTYREIGTPAEITESIENASVALEAYVAFGSLEEVQEAHSALETYAGLGDLETVTEAVESVATAKVEAEVAKLVETLGVSKDIADKTLKLTGSFEAAEAYIRDLKGLDETAESGDEAADEVNESAEAGEKADEAEAAAEKVPESVQKVEDAEEGMSVRESVRKVLGLNKRKAK